MRKTMKRSTLYKSAVVFAISYLSFGCSKIADINVSPNNPLVEEATPQVLFPSAVISAAGRIGGELNILGGIWSQYWTQAQSSNQYKSIDAYNITRIDLNGDYNELFGGALSDLQLAINKSKAAGQNQYYLMSTVMKAYVYQVLVDLYDQVPYSQAFQGQANIQPKFDDGYTIYKGLLAEIDAALATNYNKPLSADDSKADFLFGGDGGTPPANEMDNWRKFANTLKLKMYLRMVNAKPAEAQAGVQALLSGNADFLTTNVGPSSYVNATTRNTIYTDATNKRNPFYTYNIYALNTTTNLRASKTLVSLLEEANDPRIVTYFGSTNPGTMDQGNNTASQAAQPGYATSATPIQKATDPVYFITAAESYFLQAEAAERYNGGTNASTLYNNGVTAAFAEVGVANTAKYPAYPTAGTFEQKLRAIITQKWLSFPYGCHTLEGFFDQERTGYPKTTTLYSTSPLYLDDEIVDDQGNKKVNYTDGYVNPTSHAGEWVFSASAVTPVGKFPKRLVFPDSERSRNNNTPAEVPITTPVWWGK